MCGKRCWRGDLDQMEARIRETDDAPIWRMRTEARKSLIEYIRSRYARQVAIQGGSDGEIAEAGEDLRFQRSDARICAAFRDLQTAQLAAARSGRLLRILRNPQRPAQLVIAGKAHPQDQARTGHDPPVDPVHPRAGARSPVIFLSDYDMLLTERLVGGVDVWINTPRRPWEASGTSGMKVLVNGGLNLSELDGWWAEAYAPDVGWAIGDGREHGDDPAWDAAEAEALYALLEHRGGPGIL